MKGFLRTLLSLPLFTPHEHCYLWQPSLVILHAVSDVGIAIAYYATVIALIYFVCKRDEVPFSKLFLLFSAFMVACGTTHLIAVWTLGQPVYWLAGALKLITATLSIYTAVKLILLLPRALNLSDLAAMNQARGAEIAARQITETSLRESEERFRCTFEQAAVGIAHVSSNGQFIRLNQRFCNIVGYVQAELQTMTFQELTHPDDLASDLRLVHGLLSGNIQTYSLEKRYIHKDRSIVWVNLTVSLVREDSGEPKYFISTVQDISDRKWVELALRQSEATLKLFVKYVPAGIAMLNTNFCYVFASQRWLEDYGLGSVESIIGHSHYELFPEIPERWRQIHQRCLAGAIERCEEDLFKRADGSQQCLRWEVRPWYTANQSIGGIIIFSEDITERKQAKIDLQTSEERLRLALMATKQGLYDLNLKTGTAIVTPEYATMLGYDPIGFQETNAEWSERLHPDDQETVANIYRSYIAGDIPDYQVEFRQRTANGGWKWILSLGKIVAWDEDGQPLRMLGTHTDISDRKQAELLLQEANQRITTIWESMTDAYATLDHEWRVIYANPAATQVFSQLTNLEPEAFLGKSHWELFPSLVGQVLEQEYRRAVAEQVAVHLEVFYEPTQNWFEAHAYPSAVGLSIYFRGISERKQAEAERLKAEKLQTELNLLESILEVTLAGYWDWDIPGHQKYLSPTLKQMLGYEDHELPNTSDTWQQLIFADDLPGVLECFDQHLHSRGEIPFYNEVRYHHKNGLTVWVIYSGRVIEWDQNGQPLRMVGCHIDITERKRAETQLEESEAELQALFAAMTDTVIVRDREGRCLKIAPSSTSLYREPPEMLGRTLSEVLPQPEADLILASIHECLDKQITTSAEYCLPIQERLINFLASISPLSENAVLIVARDISDRKQVEANLKRYERIVSSTRDGIALLDRHYTYQVVNQAYLTWCNRPDSEVIGHSVRDVLGSELFDTFIKPRLDQCLAGQTIQYEKWFDYPNVVPQFLSVTYVPYRDVNQTIAGVIVSLRDITDLKHTEESLQISEERLQLALEGSGDGLWDWNIVTGQVYRSPLWQSMLGYAEDELPFDVSTWEHLIHPEDKPWVMALLSAHLKDGFTPYAFDYRILTKSGEWKWVANYGKVVARDAMGSPLRMVGTHKDISDRKHAEQELIRSRDLHEAIFNESADALFLVDPHSLLILDCNRQAVELFGVADKMALIGLEGHTLQREPFSDQELASIVSEMQAKGFWSREIEYVTGQGALFWGNIAAKPITVAGQTMHLVRVTDISARVRLDAERKQAETALRASEHRYATLTKAAPVAIFRFDTAANCVYINERWSEMTGRPIAEGLGEGWAETIHPQDRERIAPEITQWFQTCKPGELYRNEARILRPDNSVIWYVCQMLPETDSNNTIVGYVGTLTDITNRKQAEQALQELSIAMQNAVEGISRIDVSGRYLAVNRSYANICGYEPEELIGQPWQQTVYSEDVPTLNMAYQQMLQSGKVEVEARGLRKEGAVFYKQVTMVTAHDEDGVVIGHHCFLKDISDRKQAETALTKYAHEVEDLYNNAPCGYHSLDAAGRFVKVNETELQWLGYTQTEMLGKPFIDFVAEASRAVFEQSYSAFKERGWAKDLEFDLICKDGTLFPVLISATAVKNEDGVYLHSRSTLFDRRDRKRVEEQLRLSSERISLANAELARAARLKDEFLAGMSHELRTPLNAILGLSEALLEEVYGDLTPNQRESLQTIAKSGEHLLALINDILDLSKIESGKMELELSAVRVQSLCESSLAFVKQQANHKQIKLSCQIADGLVELEADERRLRQVLVNLLNNAVKFTPEKGAVQLQVRADRLRELIEFSITDTGIGIAPENMNCLFQPFVQLDSSLSRHYEGTGLGLALVRRILDLHGGSVSLESEIGKGSCFTIALPWEPSMASINPNPHCDLPALPQPNINRALVVEDSAAAANQMVRYLTNLGAQTTVHAQGEGVLEAVMQVQPDVIILDILLPDQTGWEVLTALKANLATREIPVIMASVVDSRSRGLALGAAAYLLKPITRQQFQHALSQVLSASPSVDQTALVLTANQSPVPPLILLAEDNEANITTTTLYLQAHGLQIIVARNGREAIQMAQQYRPALILMDIQMPEIDGLEATCRIRSDTALSQIPIIALTALAMPGDRERCLAAGADAYLTKPVSLKQLLTVILTYVPTLQTSE